MSTVSDRPAPEGQTADRATMAGYNLGQATRIAWYLGHYVATRAWFSRIEPRSRRRRSPGVKGLGQALRGRLAGLRIQRALTRGALDLLARDAGNVRHGRYALPRDLLPRPGAVGEMAGYWRDLPKVALRRRTGTAQEPFREHSGKDRDGGDPGYPRYYLQNFHFQSGGWLTDESAALYDTQVEVLFCGLAQAMRRQGVVAVTEWLRAQDTSTGSADGDGHTLVDLGTGTGAMLEAVRDAAPALDLSGLDLSPAYLERAKARLSGAGTSDAVTWLRAPAEAIPLDDASVDLITATYLFHELPKKTRAQVLAEVHRVLKPGGRFVLTDSLQLGDTPDLDPVLRSFPEQFHEPYYADWIAGGTEDLLAEAGFTVSDVRPAYLSKVFVAEK